MKNMAKGLTVLKWVLINPLKIPQMGPPQMPKNVSAQIVCSSPKDEKRLHCIGRS